nr:olfactory receptor 7A10-like [Dasypus novemcinctus]
MNSASDSGDAKPALRDRLDCQSYLCLVPITRGGIAAIRRLALDKRLRVGVGAGIRIPIRVPVKVAVLRITEAAVARLGGVDGSHIYHIMQRNDTRISEILLLGLSKEPELQPLLFGLFLSMYLVTCTGNLLIILAIISDTNLHTPMYFFLCNLSLCDICFSSTTVPNMLVSIQTESRVISYGGCITQIYFVLLFAALEDFLLAAMAYDRFVAICHPLHYSVIMNPRICVLLVLGSWIMTVLNSLLQRSLVLQLSFCTHVEIPHFFCEINQMVQLACSDTFIIVIVMYFVAGVLGGGPVAGILFSYSKIVSSICAISKGGKYKAFSTCASHLLVVSLFYCTGIGVYLSSAASHNTKSVAPASVMYTVVTPMLNPFIYSLRNKDIKGALKKFFGWKI